jgi:polysaccharide export outer membrane protein
MRNDLNSVSRSASDSCNDARSASFLAERPRTGPAGRRDARSARIRSAKALAERRDTRNDSRSARASAERPDIRNDARSARLSAERRDTRNDSRSAKSSAERATSWRSKAVWTSSALALVLTAASLRAQTPPPAVVDYVVGAQDVLTITCYDQADLSGKFTVETDGTFTYPLIGRVKVGGLTLRQVESQVKTRLVDDGYFRNPQITVAVDTYKSQKVFIVGEVRTPGTYPLSGDMNLVEALARAGSTLPSASGEAIIVHPSAGGKASGPTLPTQDSATDIDRVDLHDLQNGVFSQNAALRDGDTIFVPRAESVYVFGQVKNPGAYALQQRNTTVLQALSLAGGVTDRGTTSRVKIMRIINGEKREIKVKLTDLVQPGDTVVVSERFF